jgi:polysaccharide export outer membrane protein
MKICVKNLIVIASVALAVSCASPKKIGYLLDMEYGQDYPAAPSPELVVQVDDQLGVNISCEDPRLVAPFNLIAEGAESTSLHTYAVNREGNIDFPILGSLPVAGKTLKEIKGLITNKIQEMGLIRNPVVVVTLENFSITVIGNAGNLILPVTGNSINLLQVVAQSAPIDANVKIKDVMVIRTENGMRKSYSVNLKSKDLFESPVYYLKQNDVVYFKPQGTRLTPTGEMAMSFVSTGLTLASIITNFLLWSRR